MVVKLRQVVELRLRNVGAVRPTASRHAVAQRARDSGSVS
jgi:hypothetical protein